MIKELNHRETSYGVSVTMLWDDSTDEITIELETNEDWQSFPVPSDEANAAFSHPFVYAARAIPAGNSAVQV